MRQTGVNHDVHRYGHLKLGETKRIPLAHEKQLYQQLDIGNVMDVLSKIKTSERALFPAMGKKLEDTHVCAVNSARALRKVKPACKHDKEILGVFSRQGFHPKSSDIIFQMRTSRPSLSCVRSYLQSMRRIIAKLFGNLLAEWNRT